MPAGRRLRLMLGLALTWLLAPAGSSDDWDWGAFEAIDDAPVTSNPGRSEVGPGAAAQPPSPRPAATNVPDYDAPPRPAYAVFPGIAPFEVIPSRRDAEMHPCANCHQWVTSNPAPRRLQAPHDNIELDHGLHGHGEFWCFTCHDMANGGGLKTLEGRAVEFADAYVVCSQCHARQAHDWAHGAHGKRVGNWQGKRQVLNCTACHYQHRPALSRRAPMPGPAMRVGLPRPGHWVAAEERPHRGEDQRHEWQRDADRRRESAHHHDQTPDTAANAPPRERDAES
jgi:hypothetical protein